MRRKRILLVNPWIEDFAAYDFWLKPVGLLYVGSFLKTLGLEVTLIDLMNRYDPELQSRVKVPRDKFYGTGKFPHVEIAKPPILSFMPRKYKRYGMPEELFREKLRRERENGVDAVFVTSTLTYWYPGYFDTISVIKEELDAPIFFGGFFVRNQPSVAKRSGTILFTHTDLRYLPRFLNRTLGWELPEVDIDWFTQLSPAYELYEKVGYVVLLTTLGCPYRCTYCIAHRNWERMRFKPVELVLEEIEKFSEILNVQDIVFFDDAILVNAENHFKPLLKEIIRRGLNKKLRFHLPNGIHARLLTQEIADLLYEANFKTIKLGYETAGKLQRTTGDKIRDEDLLRAARILKNAGFTHKEVSAYIMVNLPGQTVEDVMNAVDVCVDAGIDYSINEFTPIVGTDIWIELVNKGLLTGREDPLLLNNTVLPYWWKNMSVEQIQFLKEYGKIKKAELSL
ncbi:B12-binding domain-containing radical SAM protein [Fervidobacterium thailandense]|uniref:Radical SAM protein n=1 Tax=Fervidobacterium thailandense TaxID=1008305 RepID=A0A1E3G4T0_9BACT|nr:radical SAM protein [Fervidobacterium thailandense]ODN30843.1 radical SAM protein [Fervidobacterium thailandense]